MVFIGVYGRYGWLMV